MRDLSELSSESEQVKSTQAKTKTTARSKSENATPSSQEPQAKVPSRRRTTSTAQGASESTGAPPTSNENENSTAAYPHTAQRRNNPNTFTPRHPGNASHGADNSSYPAQRPAQGGSPSAPSNSSSAQPTAGNRSG